MTLGKKRILFTLLVAAVLIFGIYTLWYYTMSNGKIKINNFVDEKYIELRDDKDYYLKKSKFNQAFCVNADYVIFIHKNDNTFAVNNNSDILYIGEDDLSFCSQVRYSVKFKNNMIVCIPYNKIFFF